MVHFTQCGFRALFHSSVRITESPPLGCPIREPRDQGTLAPPPGLSRPAAPFLAGRPQGIRLGPALAWPYCPFRALQASASAEGLLRISYLASLFVFPSLVVSKSARGKSPAPLLEIRGFEPLTSGLQSRCSSQLSYIPFSFGEAPSPGTLKKRDWGRKRIRGGSGCTPAGCLSLRKEVIQPHLPVRLPCYDFTPLAKRAFDSGLLAVGLPASGALHSDGVTGGVYKARERIHRAVLMRDY